MYDHGHFCLLICPHGNYEENYKKHLNNEMLPWFLFQLFPRDEKEASEGMWNYIEKSPLFEPTSSQKCVICNFLYKIFKENRVDKDGIIWFSHNILDNISFKSFFTPLLKDNHIQKLIYLELDSKSEGDFLLNKKVNFKKINSKELFDLKDKNQFECSVLYEILNVIEYTLDDISGIGTGTIKKLEEAGIHTLKDLINCNVKLKAKEIQGVGVTSLNKWKQEAKSLLNK
ncbi:MAG: helix-hairpin-helix domain-containing protein [Promethearchaeota archaeon]